MATRGKSLACQFHGWVYNLNGELAAIIDYLNRFPLDSMREEAQRLLRLALSVAEIAA